MKNWFKSWAPLIISVISLLTAFIATFTGNGDIGTGYFLAFAGWAYIFAKSND